VKYNLENKHERSRSREDEIRLGSSNNNSKKKILKKGQK
jgi:hypothetical protein